MDPIHPVAPALPLKIFRSDWYGLDYVIDDSEREKNTLVLHRQSRCSVPS